MRRNSDMGGEKIRNVNFEIRNKFKNPNCECPKPFLIWSAEIYFRFLAINGCVNMEESALQTRQRQKAGINSRTPN
jgi:hypothetical protein